MINDARLRACQRGLQFIYQHSLEESNFADGDGDYLWCFRCAAFTSADAALRDLAAEMGAQTARRWMAQQVDLPALADAGEVGYYVSLLHMSSLFGVENAALREHVRRGIHQFTARDYLGFDPLREPPQALPGRSRYDVWCDALVTAYTGEGFGEPLGASYADVVRWLPEMRPYRGAEAGANPEFRDIALSITHLVYTLNDYGRYRLSPEWLPDEFAFLQANMKTPLVAGDPELLGEFVDSLRSFGVADSDAALSASVEYLLSTQNPDGSWGDVNQPNPHIRYHTVWTAVDALRTYTWQERPKWPEPVRRCFPTDAEDAIPG